MPFYDYICEACSHQFDAFQSVNEDPISKCPSCEKHKVKKLISLPCEPKIEYNNAKEYYEKCIKPDAKRIANKIKSGDQEEAANFFGEEKIFPKV